MTPSNFSIRNHKSDRCPLATMVQTYLNYGFLEDSLKLEAVCTVVILEYG